jgi:hypothetical protein
VMDKFHAGFAACGQDGHQAVSHSAS